MPWPWPMVLRTWVPCKLPCCSIFSLTLEVLHHRRRSFHPWSAQQRPDEAHRYGVQYNVDSSSANYATRTGHRSRTLRHVPATSGVNAAVRVADSVHLDQRGNVSSGVYKTVSIADYRECIHSSHLDQRCTPSESMCCLLIWSPRTFQLFGNPNGSVQ